MIEEAQLEETENGKTVATDGWFALHVSEAMWLQTDRFGAGCRFEGQTRFPQVGVNLRVMQPGVPATVVRKTSSASRLIPAFRRAATVGLSSPTMPRPGNLIESTRRPSASRISKPGRCVAYGLSRR